MGFFDKITEQVTDVTSIVRKVAALETAINSIETWRHQQADPSILENITNIGIILDDIQTMYQNIVNVADRVEAIPAEFEKHLREVVAPDIISNITSNITRYVDEEVDKAKIAIEKWIAEVTVPDVIKQVKDKITIYVDDMLIDIKDKLKQWVSSFVGDPDIPLCDNPKDTIMGILCSAQEKANVAITAAKSILAKFTAAASQLKTDTANIGVASSELLNVMELELREIKDQFISFGNNVYASAQLIGKNMEYAANELKEATTEIKTPLSMVKLYADRARNDGLIYLPYNIFMTIAWGFLK